MTEILLKVALDTITLTRTHVHVSRKQLLLIFFYIRVHVVCARFIFCRVMRMNRFQQLFP